MLLREHVNCCPVCQSTLRAPLHDPIADQAFRVVDGKWQFYRCQHCRSVYLSPRPTEATIGQTYAQYYTHESPSIHHLNEPPVAPRNQLLRALRNGYLNANYRVGLAPSLAIGRHLFRLLPRRRDWLDRLLRHLPMPQSSPRLLDVGCGNGEFMLRMRQLGWQVVGVEPDGKAAAVARSADLPVHTASLATVALPENHFDAITLSHVIEHLHDPVAALQQIRRWLKPGGVVWIATPNVNAFGHWVFGRNWVGLDPPRHLVLFTHRSLQQSLTTVGFTNIQMKRAYRSAQWAFPISYAIHDGANDPMIAPAHPNWYRRLPMQLANLLTILHPRFSEELLVIAQKSTG